MQGLITHTIQGQTFWLTHHRAIFWEQQRALIVSDCHLGKTGHFRKEGIPVPQNVYKEDLQRLVHLIQHFQPAEMLVVGDFFHSRANQELELFKKWRNDLPHLPIKLIRGNHDILSDSWYHEAAIELHKEQLLSGPFLFSHQPSIETLANTTQYHLSGHIHPGIRIHGMGKQTLQFPCFYFGPHYAVLPAFSRFTGTAAIAPKAGDHVFAIVNQTIIPVHA